MVPPQTVEAFRRAALSPDPDLAVAALMIARVERPALDAGPYLDELDRWGRQAAERVAIARAALKDAPRSADPQAYASVLALNEFVFGELGFQGDERQYEDPRNSFLNEVLDRRTGIPITLALVYMEVARRANVPVSGINFPGRFLLRSSGRQEFHFDDLIIDPFSGGTLLNEERCRALLRQHAGEDAVWHERLLGRATKPQILIRMLLNLKRAYVRIFSFPQARNITELMLAVDPAALNELRDRGLLAYHLNDFSAALRDLQTYLRLASSADLDEDDRTAMTEIWEHVKTLRRRVASFN